MSHMLTKVFWSDSLVVWKVWFWLRVHSTSYSYRSSFWVQLLCYVLLCYKTLLIKFQMSWCHATWTMSFWSNTLVIRHDTSEGYPRLPAGKPVGKPAGYEYECHPYPFPTGNLRVRVELLGARMLLQLLKVLTETWAVGQDEFLCSSTQY